MKNPLKLIDMGPGVFNAATVDTNILLVANRKTADIRLKALTLKDKNRLNVLTDKDFLNLNKLNAESWIILSPEEQRIKEKIERLQTSSIGKSIFGFALGERRGVVHITLK